MRDSFIWDGVNGNSNIQNSINFNVIWIEEIFFIDLYVTEYHESKIKNKGNVNFTHNKTAMNWCSS